MTGTKHQYSVTASVQGYGPLGVFDTMTGGETDSTDTKHHPGAMGPEEPLGGPATTSNVVISRNFKFARDRQLRHQLRPLCGKRNLTIKKQPLDVDGHPIGNPEVFTGVLKRIQTPEPDSDSGDMAMVEIEQSTGELVG